VKSTAYRLEHDLLSRTVRVHQVGEEGMVERQLPEVARVVHEALALELLEGVAQHGRPHGLTVGQELLGVGAAGELGVVPLLYYHLAAAEKTDAPGDFLYLLPYRM